MQHLIIERRGYPNVREKERHHIPMCDRSAEILQGLDITDRTILLRELHVIGNADSVLGWDNHSTPSEREQQAAAVPPAAHTYHDLYDARTRFKKEVTELLNERCGRLPDEMAWRMLCDLRDWITGKIERLTANAAINRGNGDHSS